MQSLNKTRTRIMIVDDHPIVREGFSSLISAEPDLQVSAQLDGVTDAQQQIANDLPDLLIVDISLKDGSGLELIKQLKCRYENLKILVVSMHDESLYAERCLRAGAMGYVHKQQAIAQLITAIRTVLKGKLHLSEHMTERMLCRSVGSANYQEQPPLESLSDRELEVFESIGQGETTRQIAAKLHLSPKTVETYRENIKHKLDLENATELTQHAVQWALEKR